MRLKIIDEWRNYLFKEIKHKDLMGEKHKKTFKYLSYFEHFPILILTSTVCVSIYTFTSLVGVPVSIACSEVGINICASIVEIKNYESIIWKKKKYDKIVLLGKANIDTIKVLISRALID